MLSAAASVRHISQRVIWVGTASKHLTCSDVPKTPLKNTTEASYGRKSWLDLPFSLVITTHAGSKPRMTTHWK
jgi:hypothetical protein